MRIGSLFSGIGGLELGLEAALGGETIWQVEREDFARRVLEKHWPGARRFDDVRTVGAHNLEPVDLICGGFPCQDVSWAGAGAGLDGERSGLWSEFRRVVRELRPVYVVVENVAALLARGLATVLGDLAASGYDAEWSTVSACSVGAPHMRQRLFVVAYADSVDGRARIRDSASRAKRPVPAFDGAASSRADWRARLANPSALYGGADGLPDCMDRNRAIGNSIFPQIPEMIGRAILAAEPRKAA
jgi:DNA (cytosine-5)-methyltransferase 1